MRLQGKTALITGATSGIGESAARIFAAEGANVVLAGRRAGEGERIAAEIRDAGHRAIFVQTDVTQAADVEAVIDLAVKSFGALHILFNNAGGSTPRDTNVVDMDISEFWSAIERNLFGAFLCCRFAIPRMIAAGGGSIINNASYAGLKGISGDGYTAAKGGLIAMTRSMSVAQARVGIRVNALAPGVVGTERIARRALEDPVVAEALSAQPLGLIPPEEVAYAALYLASDEARTTTGQTFYLNGGGQ